MQKNELIIDDSQSVSGLDSVLQAFRDAGYKNSRETKKLIEYEIGDSVFVYLIKTSLRLNNIVVIVHPELQRSAIERLDGVREVNQEYRFHSNMIEFPKRVNNGKSPTPYGLQVLLNGPPNLAKFLKAFRTAVLE